MVSTLEAYRVISWFQSLLFHKFSQLVPLLLGVHSAEQVARGQARAGEPAPGPVHDQRQQGDGALVLLLPQASLINNFVLYFLCLCVCA